MKNATPLPITPSGDSIPVMDSDSRKTDIIDTGATPNTVVVQSATMVPVTEVMPYLTLLASGSDTITFTSLLEGLRGESISITVAAAGTEGVAYSGNDITITPKTGTGTSATKLAELIAANPTLAGMIAVTATDMDATIDASQGKAYLNGWNDGLSPVVVCLWATADSFYGKAQSAAAGTPTAEIPIAAKVEKWDVIRPGEKICAKSATASAKVYITPSRRY